MTDDGVPTCAYRVDAALVELLDERLGPPLDSYVRGWQVWLLPNGPSLHGGGHGGSHGGSQGQSQEVLEWRLHPPARFRMPRGVDPHDLFDVVLQGLAGAAEQMPLQTGAEQHVLEEVWEVLEVFPAYTADVAVGDLVDAVTRALAGRAPDVAGRADHDRLGTAYKGSRGDFSVGQALLEALEPLPPAEEPG